MMADPTNAFFVAGGTVPPGSPSYVERSADRELFEALRAGEYCYVLNSRQMGKSSLAVRTIGKLQEAGVRTGFVDLTKLGAATVTEERWYAGLLAEIGRSLGLRKEAGQFAKDAGDLSPSQRLFAFLQDVVVRLEVPIVLIVDEIDAVRSLSFSTDAFFTGIRQCWNGRANEAGLRQLTFCLLGAALPSDLIRDVRTTPFNIGRRIELRDFTNEEARPLAAALGASGEAKLGRVLYWTGGHPFLTQSLCAELVPGGDVDSLVRGRYLDARARDTDTNLADVGNRLLGRGDPDVDERARADTLSLYAKLRKHGAPDDESNPACARIKMSGVARLADGRLSIRNRIYATAFGAAWIRENMPGQELRRQRKAFWKGAFRTAGVAAVVISALGALAVVVWKSRDEAQRARLEAERSLYEVEMASAGKELADGRLTNLERILNATEGSSNRNIEWDLLKRQTDLGLTRLPPTQFGYGLCFSPDGKTLWNNESGWFGESGAVQGYAVGTWRKLRRLVSPKPVVGIAVSPDGKTIAASGIGGTVVLWNEDKSQPFRILPGVSGRPGTAFGGVLMMGGLDFSGDGRRLAAISTYEQDGHATLLVYDRATWKPRSFRLAKGGCGLRYSPDGRRLAICYGQPGVAILEIRDAETLAVKWSSRCDNDLVTGLSWAPNSQTVATASLEGTTKIWDARTGRLLQTFEPHFRSRSWVAEWHSDSGFVGASTDRYMEGAVDSPRGIAFTTDGRELITANEGSGIVMWNIATGSVIRRLSPMDGEPMTPAVSPDGRWLAVGGGDSSSMAVLDLRRSQPTVELTGAQRMITPPAFSPDGRHMAVGDWEGRIRVYRLDRPALEKVYRTRNRIVEYVSWPADDRIVGWTSVDRQETISVATGAATSTPIPKRLEQNPVADAMNQSVYLANDRAVPRLVRLDSAGRTLESLTVPGAIQASEVSRNGEIAVALPDRIQVFRIPGFRPVRTYPITSGYMAWSPDGRYLVATKRNLLYLFNGRGLVRTMYGHEEPAYIAKFTADGSRILSGSGDRTVRIWSVATGQCLLALPQPTPPLDVRVSPDGRWLVVTDMDLKILLYPLKR